LVFFTGTLTKFGTRHSEGHKKAGKWKVVTDNILLYHFKKTAIFHTNVNQN